jgi:hypothetical protein
MRVLTGSWRDTAILYVTAAAVFTVLALGEVLLGRTSGPPPLWVLALGVSLTFGSEPRVSAALTGGTRRG